MNMLAIFNFTVMFIFFEFLLFYLRSGRNVVTKITRAILVPSSLISDLVSKKKRHIVLAIIAVVFSVVIFIVMLVVSDRETIILAVENIPSIGAFFLLDEFIEYGINYADLAYLAIEGTILTLTLDIIIGIFFGENEGKLNGFLKVLVNTLLLIPIVMVLQYVFELCELKPGLEKLLEGTSGIEKTLLLVLIIYLSVSVVAEFSEHMLAFIFLYTFEEIFYYKLGLEKIDAALFGTITMDDINSVPAWILISICIFVIFVGALIRAGVEAIFEKGIKQKTK